MELLMKNSSWWKFMRKLFLAILSRALRNEIILIKFLSGCIVKILLFVFHLSISCLHIASISATLFRRHFFLCADSVVRKSIQKPWMHRKWEYLWSEQLGRSLLLVYYRINSLELPAFIKTCLHKIDSLKTVKALVPLSSAFLGISSSKLSTWRR